MPLQVGAGEAMGLLGLGVRWLTGVVMGDEPHVVQGFWVYLGGAWWAALVAGGAAHGWVEGVVRAGSLALGAIEKAGRPAGVGHGFEEEGVEKHERIALLKFVEDIDAGLIKIGIPGGIGSGEALGGFEGSTRGGVALVVLDDARAEVIHGIGLGNGVEVAAGIKLNVEVDEELQARAEARFGAANALGHPAHEAVVAGQEHDDAIRLAEIIGADDEGAVAEIFAHVEAPPLLEAQAAQCLRVRLPVLEHLNAQVKVDVLAKQLDDFLAGGTHDAAEAAAVLALDDALLAGALQVEDGVDVENVRAFLAGQDLIDLDSHGVRELVFQAGQRGLADQLGDALGLVFIRDVVIGVELGAFGEVVHDDLGQLIQLHALGGGNWDDHGIGVFFGEQLMQGQQLGANLVLGCLIKLGDDADDGGFRRDLANILQDPTVAWADLLIRGDGQADDVDVCVGVLDYLVEALAEQSARAVQAGRVDEDDLRILAVHQAADGVAGGLGLVSRDGDLLPHQRVGQGGLAGVGAADERHEAGAEALGRVGVLRVVGGVGFALGWQVGEGGIEISAHIASYHNARAAETRSCCIALVWLSPCSPESFLPMHRQMVLVVWSFYSGPFSVQRDHLVPVFAC